MNLQQATQAAYNKVIGQVVIDLVPYDVIQLEPGTLLLDCPYLAEKLQVPVKWQGYKYYMPTCEGRVYVDADSRFVRFSGVHDLDALVDLIHDYLPAVDSVGWEVLRREE